MKTKLEGNKSNQGRRVSRSKQDSSYDASREFGKLTANKPLVYNNYGKISTKKYTLEKDFNEERIEVLLQQNK